MSTAVDGVKRKLQEHGIDIPVIEPFRAALYDALSCALMGVSQSKYAILAGGRKDTKSRLGTDVIQMALQ